MPPKQGEGIVANPQQQISQLPLLTKVEQQQLLFEWNDTQADYPQDKCIHQLFEEQVKLNPKEIALQYENQQLTYPQLNSCFTICECDRNRLRRWQPNTARLRKYSYRLGE